MTPISKDAPTLYALARQDAMEISALWPVFGDTVRPVVERIDTLSHRELCNLWGIIQYWIPAGGKMGMVKAPKLLTHLCAVVRDIADWTKC